MVASTIFTVTAPSSSSLVLGKRIQVAGPAKRFAFYPAARNFSRFAGCSSKARIFRPLAVVNEAAVVADYEDPGNDDFRAGEEPKKPRPCELYVCNIPRSVDETQLLQIFNPFGSLLSVEVLILLRYSFYFLIQCYIIYNGLLFLDFWLCSLSF